MNLCCDCGEDFTGIRLFDAHRVGRHAYTYSEGLAMDPPREDGRRCLDVDEMQERGWRLDKRGRWQDPIQAARGALLRTRQPKRAVFETSGRLAA
jgi:hypothetical protein